MGTVIEQMDRHEYRLKQCEDRLEAIHSSLKLDKKLSSVERDELIAEERQLQQAAKNHKKSLATLRGENRKTMLVSVTLLGLIGAAYMLMSTNIF